MISLTHDHFSSLPPELITWIFDIAYQFGEPSPTGPLSKRLLPYYYQSRFRSITLDQKLDVSPRQLATLADYNRFTRRIHLVEPVPRRSETVDEHRQHLLRSLVTSMTRLDCLELTGTASHIVPTIFGGSANVDRMNSHNLKHLTHISLNSPREIGSNALFRLPFVFSFLAKLPSLTSLALTGWRSDTGGDGSTNCGSADEDLTIRKVEHLVIQGPDAFESWSIPEIINHCPSLLHLELLGSEYGRSTDMTQGLGLREELFRNSVPRLPPQLKSLRLSSPCTAFSIPLDLSRYPHAFNHFLSLEHLHLGLTCRNFDQNILRLPNLRSLHLLRPNSDTFDSLHRLIHEGPGRHPLLSRIALDLASPKRASSHTDVVGRVGKVFVSNRSNQNQTAPRLGSDGWAVSTEGIADLEGELVDLLDVANQAGVLIEGEAIEALEILRAIRAEIKNRDEHNSRREELRRAREEKVKEKMNALAGGRVWKIVVK